MAWRFRVDSDELQHLHVVWGWTQGLLPYRDLFDNHMPLFHVLSAPALVVVGERPSAVLWMRLLMLPLWGAALGLTARIGRIVNSPRMGRWSAVLAGFFPLFFLCSLEYRPDDLWTVLWLLAVAIALDGPPTPKRGLATGVVLGVTAGVSLKTTLMLLALAAGTIATATVVGAQRPPWRHVVAAMAAAAAGMAIVLGLLAFFFAYDRALEPFLYGTVWHNLTPGLRGEPRTAWRIVATLVTVPSVLLGARAVVQCAPGPGLGSRRAFLLLLTAFYLIFLLAAWPIVTRQDMLPVIPLLAILLTAPLLRMQLPGLDRIGGLPALVVAVEIALVVLHPSVRLAEARSATAFEADVLRLAEPGEPVLDLKGNAVFRPRPIYWVLDSVTKARIRRGLIRDDFADRLVLTGTCIVAGDDWELLPRTRRFVQEHYLRVASYPRVGSLFVAGARPDPSGKQFDVGIATTYALVAARGTPHGELDGRRYHGPRALARGLHEYRPAPDDGSVALLWTPAAARGFSPFTAGGDWR